MFPNLLYNEPSPGLSNKHFINYCRNDVMAELRSCGIPCTVILDSAVGYVMGEVHCVMLGAEGVVESGGIINKVSLLE